MSKPKAENIFHRRFSRSGCGLVARTPDEEKGRTETLKQTGARYEEIVGESVSGQ